MIPDSISCVKLDGQIWNTAIDERNTLIYLDVRGQQDQSIHVIEFDLISLKVTSKTFDLAWWTQLIEVVDGNLYFVEYRDQNDPTNKKYFKLSWDDGNREGIEELPNLKKELKHPHIYEHGGSYHKTVADFLSMELPLSCEYLEWDDKIIISYYLRSGNGFDRFILLLQDGKKVWKVKQDEQMKGFSSGSFFVFQEQLIFIKDRNEVCVFPG
ncbi:hypothetical protein [Ekhidna sp.]|uniref:hypothetical protein n=1 Tax=Ekhidna sp. TaxID=2608089 RepID=UPI003516EBEC